MTQRLPLVFGGKLVTLRRNIGKVPANIHITGIHRDDATAFAAWRAGVLRMVGDADMRHAIAPVHRRREKGQTRSATEEMTA